MPELENYMPQSPPTSPVDDAAPAEVSLEELRKHPGHWLAFSPDGQRLIASSATLADLDAQVRAAGENPEEVLLERIPVDHAIRSGAELS